MLAMNPGGTFEYPLIQYILATSAVKLFPFAVKPHPSGVCNPIGPLLCCTSCATFAALLAVLQAQQIFWQRRNLLVFVLVRLVD